MQMLKQELNLTKATTDELNTIKNDLQNQMWAIGTTHLEVVGGKLPGDNLKTFYDVACTFSDLGYATQIDYDNAKLACLYPGTTWKLAIRNADFIRQSGTRADGNGKTIGSSSTVGTQQDHQMQGHVHSAITEFWGYNGTNPGSQPANGGNQVHNKTGGMITDGTNGTPLTGVETRPANTNARYWVRVA